MLNLFKKNYDRIIGDVGGGGTPTPIKEFKQEAQTNTEKVAPAHLHNIEAHIMAERSMLNHYSTVPTYPSTY